MLCRWRGSLADFKHIFRNDGFSVAKWINISFGSKRARAVRHGVQANHNQHRHRDKSLHGLNFTLRLASQFRVEQQWKVYLYWRGHRGHIERNILPDDPICQHHFFNHDK